MHELSHLVGFCGENHPSILTFIFGQPEINQYAATILQHGRRNFKYFTSRQNRRKSIVTSKSEFTKADLSKSCCNSGNVGRKVE